MLPVVVGSHPHSPWLTECLESIRATTNREVLIHGDGGHEPAAILTGCERFDRFVFLQDSVTILNPQFWETVEQYDIAWLSGWPPMFLGVHTAAIANHLPGPVDKAEAIRLEAHLPTILDYPTIWPNITDRTALRREVKHGRDNLVLGNELWEKHKGTWA